MTTTPRTPHTPPPPAGPADHCTMRARSPEDLLAMAPVLMGYWPHDAVVMLTFGGEHSFHACMPLPLPAVQSDALRREVVEKLTEPVRRLRVRHVVLLYHSADPEVVTPLHEGLLRELGRCGVAVLTAIRADGAVWADLERPLAEPVAYDISAHPFIVQAIVSGRLTHGSREELVRSFDPVLEQVAATVAALHRAGLDQPPETARLVKAEGEWVHRRVAEATDSGRPLSVEDLARLVWAMQAVRVRDAAWSSIDRASAAAHVRLWADVVRRTPRALLAAPAALLGWAAWQAGDGATAWIAVERSQQADPDYSLAAYLASILDHAVPPDAWRGGFDWAEGLP